MAFPLPPQVVDAFASLAAAQRGKPEDAMTQAQFALGGGVLSVAIEHTGDLTHRMSERHHVEREAFHAGYTWVDDKVTAVLRMLRNRYGFEREHQKNMESNAAFHGVPLKEYLAKVDAALTAYAVAHQRLRVFNAMQLFARQAAVSLGEKRFHEAEKYLQHLEWNLETPEKWASKATEYELTSQGYVKTIG